MEKEKLMLWILEIIVLWAAVFAVQIPLRKKGPFKQTTQVFETGFL